jgi:hypothetical protein
MDGGVAYAFRSEYVLQPPRSAATTGTASGRKSILYLGFI